jgi:Tfp pilus assembly protein PilF
MGHTVDMPNLTPQHNRLALYYEKKGDKDASRRHRAETYREAGIAAFWKRNLPDARVTLERAVELEPGLVGAWFYLGEANRLLGLTATARQAYRRCLELNPDHGRAQARLALLDLHAD